jgi:hypothetical protein
VLQDGMLDMLRSGKLGQRLGHRAVAEPEAAMQDFNDRIGFYKASASCCARRRSATTPS